MGRGAAVILPDLRDPCCSPYVKANVPDAIGSDGASVNVLNVAVF
jgi:hypothetical protein